MRDDKAWMRSAVPEDGPEPPKLDTTVACSARVNNYWQGGKDHFAADRAAADRARAAFPSLPEAVRAGGPWRRRVTRFLVINGGIRQFLDLGAGLPAGETFHQMAEVLRPGCRVVYVDHDPMVLAHARALRPQADPACGFLDADIRHTGTVLAGAARTLDLGQPVAVVLSSVLHLIPDAAGPSPWWPSSCRRCRPAAIWLSRTRPRTSGRRPVPGWRPASTRAWPRSGPTATTNR